MLNVKVHDSTIRKRLWLVWKGCRRKHLLSKKNMAAQLRFAKLHLNKISGTMSFGQTRPKWRCLVIMHSSTFGENQTQHISINTSYQLSSTVVEG